MKCYDCKFYDVDYEYDDEDENEYEVGSCEAGHNEYIDSGEDCPYFKKYRKRKYVEKDTKCDICEYLSECMTKGEYVNCTEIRDTRNHVLCAMYNCRKMNL